MIIIIECVNMVSRYSSSLQPLLSVVLHILIFPDFSSTCQFSLTPNKNPWFSDLEEFYFSLTISWPMATLLKLKNCFCLHTVNVWSDVIIVLHFQEELSPVSDIWFKPLRLEVLWMTFFNLKSPHQSLKSLQDKASKKSQLLLICHLHYWIVSLPNVYVQTKTIYSQ